ncbi:hypothetical protein ACNS7O_03170 [Haloferacaceae archaeon DSL9]
MATPIPGHQLEATVQVTLSETRRHAVGDIEINFEALSEALMQLAVEAAERRITAGEIESGEELAVTFAATVDRADTTGITAPAVDERRETPFRSLVPSE